MIHRQSNWLITSVGLLSSLLFGMTSCGGDDDSGLTLPQAGTDASGATGGSMGEGGSGDSQNGDGGTATAGRGGGAGKSSSNGGSAGKAGGKGGSAGKASAGNGGSQAGMSDAGSPNNEAGEGGSSGSGASGSGATGGSSGSGGALGGAGSGGTSSAGDAGEGGTPGEEPQPICIFHSDPAPVDGGEGGAPAAPRGVEVGTNAFLGPYLTDLAGFTLYIYGADVPGDCNNAPVSNCSADCAIAWPPFDAGERTLDETLDPSVFGTLARSDGTFQTTYYGWPLYYYKSDTAANTINGQGKGKTWFAAETALPNLMIMRGPTASGGIKYLSDDRGHTLYALSGDTIGHGGDDPVSGCTGECLDSFRPFAPGDVFPVTAIEPHDVSLFFRADGHLQTAYKGAPLYFSKLDVRPGEQNGVGVLGGAVALP